MPENASRQIVRELQTIEQRSRPVATDLPTGIDDKDYTEGLLFTLLGHPAACLLGEVTEILNYPSSVTPVPATRDWVIGLANVRGNLLPLLDLQVFLGGSPITSGRRNRILVIGFHDQQVGLSIGTVNGVRQFTEEQRVAVPDVEGTMSKYLTDAFQLEEQVVPVFSMALLAESAGFQVAAA